MLPLLESNPSFSAGQSGLQIAWDSTSMGALKKCPRFYQLSIIEGWAPRQESVHLRFGILYHSALEKYHRARTDGMDYETAVRLTVRWVMCETWNHELNRPWSTEDPNKNRYTLVRSIVWYLEKCKDYEAFSRRPLLFSIHPRQPILHLHLWRGGCVLRPTLRDCRRRRPDRRWIYSLRAPRYSSQ